MKITIIEDDGQARSIARQHGVEQTMIAEIEKRTTEAQAAGIGTCIYRRSMEVTSTGFEAVLLAYFANFVPGENGWTAVLWTEITWEDLPSVVEQIIQAEKQLPEALGSKTAHEKLEAYKAEHGT